MGLNMKQDEIVVKLLQDFMLEFNDITHKLSEDLAVKADLGAIPCINVTTWAVLFSSAVININAARILKNREPQIDKFSSGATEAFMDALEFIDGQTVSET